MHRRIWPFVASLSLLLTSIAPQPSLADGKNSTFNIVGGAALIYLASKRLQAQHVIDHNKQTAIGLLQAPVPDLENYDFDTQTRTPALSFISLRHAVLGDVRDKVHGAAITKDRPTPPPWGTPAAPRLQYETLRSCWNALIFATSQSNTKAVSDEIATLYPTPSPTPSPKPSSTPSPAATPKDKTKPGTHKPPAKPQNKTKSMAKKPPNGGDSSGADSSKGSSDSGTGNTPSPAASDANASPDTKVDTSMCAPTAFRHPLPGMISNFDSIDALNAFSAPSLSAQIVAGNVEAYSTENSLRLDVVYILAQNFMRDAEGKTLTATQAKGFLPSWLTGLYKDCYSSQSALSCADDLVALEQGLEKAYAADQSCSFARAYWLPPFSAAKKPWASKDTDPDFGPVPGCT